MDTGSSGRGPEAAWLSPEEARDALRSGMQTFFDDALAHLKLSEGEAPARAFAVSAGLGKTATALRLITEDKKRLLQHGHVVFYAPTLDLADRAAADFRKLAPDVPTTVLRGRDAINPATGQKMCAHSDLAKKISGIVPSVTTALCRRNNGKAVQSSCAAGCPYLGQMRDAGSQVIFTSHAYLATSLPIPGDVSLQVIDEKVWPSLIRHHEISLDAWISPPEQGLGEDLADAHGRTLLAVLEALKTGGPIIEAIKSRGVSAEDLACLAAREDRSAPNLRLSPQMNAVERERAVSGFERVIWVARKTRARIFRHLANAYDRQTTERLTLESAGESGTVLCLHERGEIDTNAPTLLLDADADPAILEAIWPGARLTRISVRPRAQIVQATDSTLSNTYLLDAAKGAARRSGVRAVVEAEVKRGAPDKTLLVATKKVLCALRQDVEGTIPASDEMLRRPFLGAHVRWFGPRMMGVNDFEAFETIVLVGRLQPPVPDLERGARALFGDGATPLTFAENSKLLCREVHRPRADGQLASARIQDHPDPRVSALLRQQRECHSEQAIARLRLLTPSRPKRVVILGSLVLPGLPVTSTTTLGALLDGLEDEPDADGYRVFDTLLGSGSRPELPGLRLSKAGLHEDLTGRLPTASLPPRLRTINAIHEFRRSRETPRLVSLISRLAMRRGWPVTPLDLAKPGGGRPAPAVVFAGPEEAPAVAASIWPHHEPRLRLGG